MYISTGLLILILFLVLPMDFIGFIIFSVISFVGIGLFLSKLISFGSIGAVAWYTAWYHDFPFGCIAGTIMILGLVYALGFVFVVTRVRA